MNQKSTVLLLIGALLIVAALGLTWFGFTTNNPNPVPALSSLTGAILSFIVAVVLISKGVHGMPAVGSLSLLRKSGNLALLVGTVLTVYAAFAFFPMRDLPPNSVENRLPSLYLLFAGMLFLSTGTVIRNFRLR